MSLDTLMGAGKGVKKKSPFNGKKEHKVYWTRRQSWVSHFQLWLCLSQRLELLPQDSDSAKELLKTSSCTWIPRSSLGFKVRHSSVSMGVIGFCLHSPCFLLSWVVPGSGNSTMSDLSAKPTPTSLWSLGSTKKKPSCPSTLDVRSASSTIFFQR